MGDATSSGCGCQPPINRFDDCYRRALGFVAKVVEQSDERARRRLFRFSSLTAGASLNLANEPSDAAYVVVRGSAKRIANNAQHEKGLRGFHLPGAFIFLSMLSGADFSPTLVALEQTSLWRVHVDALPTAMKREAASLCSEQLRALFEFHLGLVLLSPEQRLSAFLLRVSAQLGRLEFQLLLENSDVAEILDCSLSDVTAGLDRFAARGWIKQVWRRFRLLDVQALLRQVNG